MRAQQTVIWPDGTKLWYQRGFRHREDGPAIIWTDGNHEYWLNDRRLKPGSTALKLVKEKERRRECQQK
jgi:hypothetical protein